MKKLAMMLGLLMLLSGCAVPAHETTGEAAPVPSAEPTPESTPEPTPEPTPAPINASIGFVGDILMMTSQISAAEQEDGSYDFSHSFWAIQPLFESVDLMTANFEGTLAGEDAGYTQPRGDKPEPTAEDPNPFWPYQSFNAPDELAQNLRDVGIDFVTTANNHCLDRGLDGLKRTVEVLDAAGVRCTGTYATEESSLEPCVVDVKGIKVAFISATDSYNRNDSRLGDSEWAANDLDDEELMAQRITEAKAVSDFVIVCPHWGKQYQNEPDRGQVEAAEFLIDCGADAVVGSHPHVVQPIEWVTTEKGNTAPVVYCLSNFISNMSIENTMYGMFFRLDIEKTPEGETKVIGMSYIPTLCLRQKLESGKRLHQALPCWEDVTKCRAFEPMSESELEETRDAFDHVVGVCGEDNAKLIDWNEEYDKQA